MLTMPCPSQKLSDVPVPNSQRLRPTGVPTVNASNREPPSDTESSRVEAKNARRVLPRIEVAAAIPFPANLKVEVCRRRESANPVAHPPGPGM